jgi:membrane dipeptidase
MNKDKERSGKRFKHFGPSFLRGENDMFDRQSIRPGAIDLHCDTLSRLAGAGSDASLYSNGFHVDIEKLRNGGVGTQFFAVYVDIGESPDPLALCLEMIDRFYSELERYSAHIAFAGSSSDIIKNHCEGKLSAFLALEDSGIIDGSLSALRVLHRLGVRLVTLTWNHKNSVGSPNIDRVLCNEGLTPHGIGFIHEMERLGMLIDVSHLSDAGFRDVAREIRGPFLASHSNSRTITAHPRNFTDDMIRTVGEHGGVIGVNFYTLFSEPFAAEDIYSGIARKVKGAGIQDIVRHINHIVKTGGIDSVALGSDFDGIDLVPEGLENASRLPALFDALEKAGYSEDEIEKIKFRNAFRVIEEVCG